MKKSVSLMIFFSFYLLSGAAFAEGTSNMHKPHQHRHHGYAAMKNPIAMTAQSIAEGKKLYDKNCMACHGDAGKGGIGLDLRGPVRIHGDSDGEIFHVITDGVKGTAMRGFGGDLSVKMRWHLVNYIKSLGEKEK